MAKNTTPRWDTLGKVTFDAQRTPEGFLQARAPMTKCGVFAYEQKDGTILRELRHPDDVYAATALKSMEQLPIQVDHVAMLTPDNCQALQVGQVGNNIEVGAPHVWGNLRVTTRKGIDAATVEGKDGLSCGYFCDLVMEPGVYNGEQYDARQINIVYNHLALCTTPRLGDELRVSMDSAGAFQTDRKPRNDSDPQKETPMNVKILAENGIQYDALPEVAAEISRLNKALGTAKTDAATAASAAQAMLDSTKATMQAAIDKATGRADAAEAKVTELDKEVKAMPTKIADGIKSRIGLVEIATKAMDAAGIAKLDSMTELDIKKAVIMARDPEAKLDDKSEAYIQAAFDFNTKNLDQDRSDSALAAARAATAPRHDSRGAVEGQDAARDRMKANLANGNKVVAAK